MNFPSIDIQGSILSTDLLGKIRSEQANFQQGKDFNLDFTNAKLKDEISFAWQEAKGQWSIYRSKLARLKDGESGTTETRNFWVSPLLTNLSYNLMFSRNTEEFNGKKFSIGYRDSNLDNFPIYIGGYYESLDKRPENKQLNVSPHALLQEYLNYSEHLYGIVTNGRQLRLLRDASRITRLSYLEFDLERIMEEDLYSDFVIFYRLLHSSRMPKKIDEGAESIIEKYHQEGLEAGSTIRNKLGAAVKMGILNLANGFINHPGNIELRKAFVAGQIWPDEYYHHQLLIVYRLLFLFVIEERNLVYVDNKKAETKRFNEIYFKYYSLFRLRKLAKKLQPPEANRHYDLWRSLTSTFSLFESKEIGEKMGIMSLQGTLFGYNAISGNYYDLHQCYLSNAVLLDVIKLLGYFENENKVLIAVNYGGLDVEEFGSVYEGLLELKLDIKSIEGTEQYICSFSSSNERSNSGSHYTPEELVQPLIKHSLEYLIEDRVQPYYKKKITKEDTVDSLLSLKICDVSCGSGHILLSAARRVALAVARIQSDEEQPNPLSIRKAMKDVVRNCIYGVDKNPLAIELCKIALWLEVYNPGEPLNFLEHNIKCGNAIIGLAHRAELQNGIADEAYKILPGDDKEVAGSFLKMNKLERKNREQLTLFSTEIVAEMNVVTQQFNLVKKLPEGTPDEVEDKAKAYLQYEQDYRRIRMKQLADAQLAQFFIRKTNANRDVLITDGEYQGFLRQMNKHLGLLQSKKLAKSHVIADRYNANFFHWFLEFPEVFEEGGFDCVLGNPPFLGGQKISGNYGDAFLESIKYQFAPIGAVDLVTYFFRRIFSIIKKGGFQSLISTNTIAQGKAREDGLDVIIQQGGTINHAIKSMKWPGVAAVDVALITITKQQWKGKFFLTGKEVKTITSYLDDAETYGHPYSLIQNIGKSFQGSIVLGKGFVLEPHEAEALILKDPKNKDVLYPYLNGDDLNNNPDQRPSRWVINFFDWPEEEARRYSDCYRIIEKLVKPERQRWAIDKEGREVVGEYALRKPLPEKWWIYGEKRPALYRQIENIKRVLVITRVSKYVNVTYVSASLVYMDKVVVLSFEDNKFLSLLQSTIYDHWAWRYSSTLGSGTINFSPNDCFETFPFPQNLTIEEDRKLGAIGEAYYKHRKQLMLALQLGLTKTYNMFHSSGITAVNVNESDKIVLGLRKHLEKTRNSVYFEESIRDILKLRDMHKEMDIIVLEAYGWGDIQLLHDFYEVDYLPENDRIRFTIHPDARKEVLKRLLELNHRINAEEQNINEISKVKSRKAAKRSKPKVLDTQLLFPMRPETAYAGIYSVQDIVRITRLKSQTIKRWLNRLNTGSYEGISEDSTSRDQALLLNFYGIHELIVIYDLRVKNKIPLQDILDARVWLKERFGNGRKDFYPFTSQKVLDTISKAGRQIIFSDELTHDYITLGKGNSQLNLDFIKDILRRIVFDKEMVSRLYLSDSHLIAIDPNLAGGRPCTVDNAILIDSIKSMYLVSPNTKYIADTYEISEAAVKDALDFELASVLN